MIIQLVLPDETNMVSLTTAIPVSTEEDFGTVTTQALFDPRDVKEYKLEYDWKNEKPVSGKHYHNGTLVSEQSF